MPGKRYDYPQNSRNIQQDRGRTISTLELVGGVIGVGGFFFGCRKGHGTVALSRLWMIRMTSSLRFVLVCSIFTSWAPGKTLTPQPYRPSLALVLYMGRFRGHFPSVLSSHFPASPKDQKRYARSDGNLETSRNYLPEQRFSMGPPGSGCSGYSKIEIYRGRPMGVRERVRARSAVLAARNAASADCWSAHTELRNKTTNTKTVKIRVHAYLPVSTSHEYHYDVGWLCSDLLWLV